MNTADGTERYLTATMTELIEELRVELRSPRAGANNSNMANRWRDEELYHCIRTTLQELAAIATIQDVYEGVFDQDQREYDLPIYIQTIDAVEEIGQGWTAAAERPVQVYDFRHIWSPYQNTINFNRLRPHGWVMRIIFSRPLEAPPLSSTLTAAIDTDDTELDCGSSLKFPLPGFVKIGSEIVQYVSNDADSLTGLIRGCFGTEAASHAEGDTVDPVFFVGANFYRAIVLGSKIKAMEMQLQNRSNDAVSLTMSQHKIAKDEYNMLKRTLSNRSVKQIQLQTRRKRRRPFLT